MVIYTTDTNYLTLIRLQFSDSKAIDQGMRKKQFFLSFQQLVSNQLASAELPET